jgi:hypothetical protein
MKSYVLISGIVFSLVVVAHIARVFAEGVDLLSSASFVFTSILSIALAGWAWRLYRQLGRGSVGR